MVDVRWCLYSEGWRWWAHLRVKQLSSRGVVYCWRGAVAGGEVLEVRTGEHGTETYSSGNWSKLQELSWQAGVQGRVQDCSSWNHHGDLHP